MSQGRFIVIDGTDGSGKGTQTRKLNERLLAEGYKVFLADFPRYGNPSAYSIERYLRGEYGGVNEVSAKRASLFFAIDRHDASFEIREKLAQGYTVISNRYVSANKGHQTGKITDPAERKAFVAWLNELEYDIFGIPKPDLTILLHVPSGVSYQLIAQKDERGYLDGKKRDIHEADADHLRAAEEAYLEMLKEDTAEHWQLLSCVEGGNLLPIDTIHERLWEVIKPLLPTQS
jgi:dTMP kinase